MYDVVEHDDVLPAVFARLLLWTLPAALPDPFDVEGGWTQYLWGWRPGAVRRDPILHRARWTTSHARAWATLGEVRRA
mgnify:FL=1